MSSSLKSLGLDRLTIDERIELVGEIWDDIAATVESRDIPQSHKDLLDERLADHQVDPRLGNSWAEVKTRIDLMLGATE